jgi:predicted transcriptional regulator
MKTAVSIPDDIFERAETLAHRAKRSRSEVYSCALSEYVARHSPDSVTEAMNRVLDDVDDVKEPADGFASRAARRTLERSEW